MRQLRQRSLLTLVLGIALGLAVGTLGTGVAGPGVATVPGTPTAPDVALVQVPLTSATFAKLAEAVKPAVINVTAPRRAAASNPLEEFFGREGRGPFRGMPETPPRRGLGSGFLIDPSGVALTNAHVVEGATEVEVTMLDGSKHKARVVGVDRKTDLAVIKLEGAKAFPHLTLGDSDETQVGDWVLAVGSPFGLQATVTSGIVSAKARQIGAGPYDDFLQTDAAINPGNSGGPLVNMRGEVIGINTAIVRGGSGIGFAIPANLARRISSELLATGTVTRGWLGVSLQPLTPELAESFGARDRKGALVSEVVPDSPAARAGLRAGDIVQEFNGRPVDDPGDLARAVGMARPGEDARLTVWRDRGARTITLQLGQQPGERAAARLGLDVRPVTPEVAKELGLDRADGVVVASVEPDSPADRAGIRRGDVIREIDRKPVRNVAEFAEATSALTGDQPVTVRLQRGSSSLYVALPPARRG
jgi:serine protease Do